MRLRISKLLFTLWFVMVVAVVAVACGGTDGIPIDPAVDASSGGTSSGTSSGTTSSSSSSSGGDASSSSSSSSSGDAASDAPADTRVDTGSSSDTGTGSDTGSDTGATDAGSDASDAAVDAGPTVTLSFNKLGNGSGTVVWTGGNTCGPACTTSTSTHATGTTITLTASTANGSDSIFVGFTGGGCAVNGITRVCTFTINADTNISARFIAQPANLVFTSSQALAANLGGVAPYDTQCNDLATAAGINNVASTRYVAWISIATSLARDRMSNGGGGGVRGFVRMDGKPFADTLAKLLVNDAQIFYPIIHDENGVAHGNDLVMTGTQFDGTVLNQTCTGFTLKTGTVRSGELGGGPREWTGEHAPSCGVNHRILCVGRTMNVPISSPPPVVGLNTKRIWVTASVLSPSLVTPNQRCNMEKPAGAGAVHAVVATTGGTAAAQLSAGVTYARPDGVVVGTGAQIASLAELQAGFWLASDNTYGPHSFWTGASAPTGLGTETCTDWTLANPAASGRWGYSARATISTAWANGTITCDEKTRFLCVED